jgi:DNA-binding MarR family transcriptional regulator
MPKASKPSGHADVSQAIIKHWHEAVPNDRLAHLVKDTTRAFVRSLQVRLAEHDVSLGHWSFLRILWEHDGATQRELSIQAGVMEPTTLIAIRAMEAQGYVTREHLEGNRKNVHVFLTPLGRQLKKKLVPLAEQVNTVAVEGLSPVQVAAMRKTLLHVLGNLVNDKALEQDEASATPAAKKPRKAV